MRWDDSQGTAAATVRALSLLLAALLWLSVIVERPGQIRLSVPLFLEGVPAGLKLASAPPAKVEVVVGGPRILLWLLPYRAVTCRLDISGARAGSANLELREDAFLLPDRDLKVVRVVPGALPVTLVNR